MIRIQLGRKQIFALIDDCDLEKVKQYSWHLSSRGYVIGRKRAEGRKSKRYFMHRIIMGGDKTPIDHIDRNPLNNRRSNLRFCTNTQNQWNTGKKITNTSGFKGVSACRSRWQARIRIFPGKTLSLGVFETKELAALAYDKAAKKYRGEFASLNFPDR